MDDDRIEVVGRMVFLRDSSLEIIAEIVCRDVNAAHRIADVLQKYIQIDTITQIN